ncbi:MAG: amidohydrolase [Candidatus Marinimicrobia bacterium]|jgi:aminobenzoyl-glutamate utilization protein B|nr:amidohydrolase [Candidatus Neomarinimicrobiota bacterium]MEC7902305.1 amidohydrolase [Candidatus Neomarinimicrobiota bacterium]|tara:strand:- start:186 stop:1601 length:1416 start_codon:yes stop_codon:yes gene_type:complete
MKIILISISLFSWTISQTTKNQFQQSIDDRAEQFETIAKSIWDWAEMGYQEEKSSSLLQQTLKEEGFSIQAGVADLPTAFIAEYGSGSPIIGILAEFDALPGISQQVATVRKPIPNKNGGHACGHHLFGTASTAAAITIKNYLNKTKTKGTIRLYGTPAEEGGSGKVYMVRSGLFDDVDIVLDWHASDKNAASPVTSMANRSAKFRFYGYSAHAAGAPEKARSSLDAVEAMNFMVNLMREHIPDGSRIHYVITKGGNAPNVVPDFAEVFYYVRDFDVNILEDMWSRLINTAEAAALGTGTRMEYEIIHGNRPVLPNEVVQKVMYDNLVQVGGVSYTRAEQKFAKEIYKTLIDPSLSISSAKTIQPYKFTKGKGSTDVGDVSWKTPTARLRVATWVPGTSAHTWQAVAAGGMSIGMKGMINASKVLVGAAIDLYNDPKTVKNAKKELIERRGPGFNYYSMLGDRNPPLDYRK